MNAKCSICFDVVSEETPLMATPCGHLYCLDCATFNFAGTNATCAICRKRYTLRDLIRLFPDYDETKQKTCRPRYSIAKPRPSVAERANKTTSACYDALGNEGFVRDPLLTASALQRVDRFIDDINVQDSSLELKKALKSIRIALAHIRTKLDAANEREALRKEVARYKKRCNDLQSHMKEKERESERTLQQAAKQLSRERREWKERETGLQEKLQLTRRNLRAAREEAQNAQRESRNLEEQMKVWRTIANKFKKNYYTLKAKTRAPEYHDSDDSLEII